MANPETISYIKINEEEHPIDAVTLGGKSASDFQEAGKIVQSISASSTADQIPSAKCIYDIIYGSNGGGASNNVNTNYIKLIAFESGTLNYTLTIKEVGSGWDASDSSVLYVDNEIWTYNSVYDNVYVGNKLSTEFAKKEYGQRIYVYKDLSGAYYDSTHSGGVSN